ncbi:hypothetical protein MXB_1201 [Myxobolus squamalis]|nr:hypothetical protein MXB_1201 [Myxobolus squamalis]
MLTCSTDDCVTYSNILTMAPKIKNVATLLLFNEKCHCFLVAPGTCYLNAELPVIPEIQGLKLQDLDTDNSTSNDVKILNQEKNLYSCQEIILISADQEKCQQILDQQYVGLDSCLWLASTNGNLYVLPSSKDIIGQNKIFKFVIGSLIRVMKYVKGKILIGLENGELVIFKHKLHRWNLRNCQRKVLFESDQTPITQIEYFSRKLICCTSKKKVALMDMSFSIQV